MSECHYLITYLLCLLFSLHNMFTLFANSHIKSHFFHFYSKLSIVTNDVIKCGKN
jgi:hypothetical protein